ncbi:MAG: hypothetical protein AAF990_13405 [Bacteroidota bacterium]
MKNLIFLVLSLMLLTTLNAQQTETLFNRARVIGAFGAPIVEFGIGDGSKIGGSVGGGGALIIDNFFIGGYGMGSSDIDDLFNDDEFELSLGHGGFWVGFTTPSHKLIHLYSSLKVGWGAINIRYSNDDFEASDGVFVVTPDLGLEVNIFRWFRVGTTIGYRFVDGISSTDVNKDDFRGLIGGITFRIGGFGSWHRHSNKWREN